MTRLRALPFLLALELSVAAAAAATVHDDTGRPVSLAQPAQRIVSLAPHATELVVAAGAGGKLVGIAAGGPATARLGQLPRIGGPGAFDREALLRLQPELAVVWQSGNRPADIAWLEDSGIAVFRSEPRTLQQIAEAIRSIGRLSGTTDEAGPAAEQFERQVRAGCAVDAPVRTAYVLVWDRPALSVGGHHWINALLAAAGLRNVFAGVERGVFPVQAEALIAHRSALRVSLLRRYDDSDADRLADLLSRPGPRLAEAIPLLCSLRQDTSDDRP